MHSIIFIIMVELIAFYAYIWQVMMDISQTELLQPLLYNLYTKDEITHREIKLKLLMNSQTSLLEWN